MLTSHIGYGDLAPKSNPGRPFFVFWSLIAVPTMTILVNDLGSTVINKFKQGTFRLADFTVLPKTGVYREVLENRPWILEWFQKRKEKHAARKRLEEGFQVGAEEPDVPAPTIDDLAKDEPSDAELASRLPKVIRKVADDTKLDSRMRYSYEEWVDFTRLIRFSAMKEEDRETGDPEEEGLIEWDWIGEDSPMMSKGSEAEFVLDRLCESMNRYVKRITSASSRSSDEDTKPLPAPRRDGSQHDSLRHREQDSSTECDDIGPHDEKALDD